MGKIVLIISSSYRKNGNSETLAHQFEKGALQSGNDVEFINLRDYNINFCKGCLACQRTKKCAINDDIQNIIDKVKNAEVLVFATPIYYYSVSGQLKTFLDRMNPLYVQNYKYREVYLLTSASDSDIEATNGARKDIDGWIECFDGVKFKGLVHGGDTTDVGDILSHQDILNKAFEMGKKV